jgi:hypothetical protein
MSTTPTRGKNLQAKSTRQTKPADEVDSGVSLPSSRGRVRKQGTTKGVMKKVLRFWLTYPTKQIKEPLIWELGHVFALVTNIRQASVTEEMGIVCLEVSGEATEIESGIRWLKRKGVRVEPVELSTLDA